jgi:MIP family channel proteins
MAKGLYGSDTGQNMARAAATEIIGTMLLVSVGTLVAASGANLITIALAFSVVLTGLVYAFGPISGAHLNPAITLALAAARKIELPNAAAYIVSQMIGAILASAFVKYLYGGRGTVGATLGAATPSSGVDFWVVIGCEAFASFLLALIIMGANDERVPKAASGIMVGAGLFAAIIAVGQLSGGAVNPARALGPMILRQDYAHVLEYTIAPIVAAVAAVLLMDKFLSKAEKPDSDE